MKKVLNAIGKFFGRIWGWIKNTAWIQPLLIVGIIFGLIMSIKPITKLIQKVTDVTTDSTFYKDNLLDYEDLVKKVDDNGEKDVLIVLFIKEKNEKCDQCVNQQKDFEEFFSDDHTTAADGRNYNIAVLDIAADEFDEEKVDDKEVLRSVHEDVIEKWALDNTWDNMPAEFNAPSGGDQEEFINLNSEDPLPTPTIARFDGNTCVGVAMGFGSYDKFLRFCYADDVNNSQDSFQSVPGEK